MSTITEIADHLRLLLARVGETWCGKCGALVPRHSIDSVLEAILGEESGVTIRFTVKFDERRWHEIGEASTDGKTWNKFLEMTLERQK